jgi:YegS/Rv2252/BmrU family lipid kinase
MKWQLMLIIIKPSDKKNTKQSVEWLLNECTLRHIEPQLFFTTGHFESDHKAIANLAKHVNQAVVIGGDGSLHLAINALFGCDCSIALLPAGTGNDFARGFAFKPQQWRDAVFSGHTQLIDVGKINQRYFINVAGVGFDADVVSQLNQVGRFTAFGYLWQGIKQLFSFQAKSLSGVFADKHEEFTNLVTLFANHHYFGGGLKIAPHAILNDGELECYRMPAGNLVKNLGSFLHLIFVKHHNLNELQYCRLSRAEIHTAGLLIEADGELVGVTPAKVVMYHQALRFHLP